MGHIIDLFVLFSLSLGYGIIQPASCRLTVQIPGYLYWYPKPCHIIHVSKTICYTFATKHLKIRCNFILSFMHKKIPKYALFFVNIRKRVFLIIYLCKLLIADVISGWKLEILQGNQWFTLNDIMTDYYCIFRWYW